MNITKRQRFHNNASSTAINSNRNDSSPTRHHNAAEPRQASPIDPHCAPGRRACMSSVTRESYAIPVQVCLPPVHNDAHTSKCRKCKSALPRQRVQQRRLSIGKTHTVDSSLPDSYKAPNITNSLFFDVRNFTSFSLASLRSVTLSFTLLVRYRSSIII